MTDAQAGMIETLVWAGWTAVAFLAGASWAWARLAGRIAESARERERLTRERDCLEQDLAAAWREARELEEDG